MNLQERAHLTTDQYWATVAEPEALGLEMRARIDEFYKHLEGTGRLALYRKSLRTIYGLDPSGGYASAHAVNYGGRHGELVLARSNQLRSVMINAHNLVVGKRPAFRSRAGNDSYEAGEQALLCDVLLEHDIESSQLEDAFYRVAERTWPFGEGWLFQYWDARAGEMILPGQYKGDVRTVPLTPLDVVRDPSASIEGDIVPAWYIVRTPINRWDAIALFAQGVDEMGNAVQDDERLQAFRGARAVTDDDGQAGGHLFGPGGRGASPGRDLIWCWEMFHLPTPALPAGRYARMIGEIVVEDGPLPYDELPVHPMMPYVEEGSCFGYSNLWEALALQTIYDSVLSTCATNHDMAGINNFTAPSGDDVSAEPLAGGGRVIKTTSGEIKALQLGSIAKESVMFMELLKKEIEQCFGINAVQRGAPDENLRSGAALALVQSMAVHFNSKYAEKYARMQERAMSARIGIWRRYVTAERVYEIAGTDTGSHAVITWSGQSLQHVTRVAVELADPISQTSQGRILLADKFVQNGWVSTPEQYAQVVSTGRVEPIYKYDRETVRCINMENEMLRKGQAPQALATDNQALHIKGHAPVLSDPRVRRDPEIAKFVLAHIEEHAKLARIADPVIMAAIGEAVPPDHVGGAPGSAPAPGGDMGGAPGKPATKGEPGNPQVEAPEAADHATREAMPHMPKNPATGERAMPPQNM